MATAKEELTAKRLENLSPAAPGERYEISDSFVTGLRVRVSDLAIKEGRPKRQGKAAKVSFVLLARYAPGANPTRRTLGTFPAMSLSDARQKAIDWKALIRRGIDPDEQLKKKRLEAERERARRRTLADVLTEYETFRLGELRRGKATRRALDGKAGLLTAFVARDLASIDRSEILEALRRRKSISPISANRQLAYAKAFFNWCVAQDIITNNPVERIKKPSKEVARDRHHTRDELREIWAAAISLGYPFGPLIRLLIALPMRREEIAAIPLAELQLDDAGDHVWTLPAARTKRGNALRVPLSPLARSIIMEAVDDNARPQKSSFVFSTTGETSVSGFAKAKRKLDKLIFDNRKVSAAQNDGAVEAMPHWTLHDLRTTFATIACENLRVDLAVADRILNHVASATTSKIMRTYNKSELFEQRRLALNAWASFLETEVVGCERRSVVPFQAVSVA